MLKSVVRLALLSLINHFLQSKVARDNIAMHCNCCDTYNVKVHLIYRATGMGIRSGISNDYILIFD